MSRQNPTGLPQGEFQERFDYLREFVGDKWLSKRHTNPRLFKSLWTRKDFLASTELFTIAEALRKFDTLEFEAWLNDYRDTLKGADSNALVAKTHEIVSAYSFCTQSQTVELSPQRHPGYDFTVHRGQDSIRISCKRILVTETENSFHIEGQELYSRLIDSMKRLNVNGLQVLMWNGGSDNLQTQVLAQRNLFDQTLRDFKRRPGNRIYPVGSWRLQYRPLPPYKQGFSFYPHEISAMLICLTPYLGNEQTRFEDNFRKAANNLKKYTQNEDLDTLILYGLPNSISISQATKWLAQKFSKEHKSVGGVLLTRKVPVFSPGSSTTHVSLEWTLVNNPESSRKLKYNLDMQLPIGVPTTQESRTAFQIEGKFIETGTCYHFQKGQILYLDPVGKGPYHLTRIPGVTTTMVMSPSPGKWLGIGPISPPTDTLLLL